MPNFTQRIEVGSKVEASYMGTKFTGTVTNHRGHTLNHRVWLTFIDVDSPVYIASIGRTEDKGLLVHTAWDGSPLPPEAGDWGDGSDYVKVII